MFILYITFLRLIDWTSMKDLLVLVIFGIFLLRSYYYTFLEKRISGNRDLIEKYFQPHIIRPPQSFYQVKQIKQVKQKYPLVSPHTRY